MISRTVDCYTLEEATMLARANGHVVNGAFHKVPKSTVQHARCEKCGKSITRKTLKIAQMDVYGGYALWEPCK